MFSSTPRHRRLETPLEKRRTLHQDVIEAVEVSAGLQANAEGVPVEVTGFEPVAATLRT